MRTLSDSSIVQVSSALPSSTTMISCGTSWSRSSTWRCSTVDTMQPSSSRAGITTESNCNGAVPTGAILMRSLKLRAIQGGLERAALFLQGFARLEQWAANPTGALLWPNPARSRECHSGANQSPVPRSVFQNACTPRAQLSQRHSRTGTAGYVLHALDLPIRRLHLLPDKPRHISRMQAVAHLISVSIKTNIPKWLPSQIRVNPKGKDTLVGSTELTSTRKHPATIDPDRQTKSLTILEGEYFRSEFCGSVKRERRCGGEVLRDAFARQTCNRTGIELGTIGLVFDGEGQADEGRDRIHTAGAKQD